MIHRYGFPTEIHFGPGARRLLGEKLKELGIRKPLIVTDKNVAKLPFFGELSAAATNSAVYSDMAGNPVRSHVTACLAAYRGHAADGIVAVGGGAAIDVAKAAAILVNHDGALFDYEDGAPSALPIDRELPPILAIPTTAGTGSEVGRSAVISTDDTHQKKILFTPKMLPRVILADPEVTIGLPAGITAATGMDALTHLIEAYITIGGENPMCDGIALEGMRLVARSLRRCVEEPKDIDARGDMLNAALMGAVAFQKGLGATHSCAHALSTVCDMHHGLANGIMVPYVMDFTRDAVAEKFRIMADAVGTKDLCGWLRNLNAEINIPDKLSAAGVDEKHLDALVTAASHDVCHPLNPKPVSEKDFRGIFEAALR
ncbi:MAG: iron-containing alcohol dehydrogenase [Elusimicrobiota bacterium]